MRLSTSQKILSESISLNITSPTSPSACPTSTAAHPTKDIEIAQGEGKRPNDIMREKDWDVKAFPLIHNPDGGNGKDGERRTRLTDQSYFIQRIVNRDQRFARNPACIYAAVAFLDKKSNYKEISKFLEQEGEKLRTVVADL